MSLFVGILPQRSSSCLRISVGNEYQVNGSRPKTSETNRNRNELERAKRTEMNRNEPKRTVMNSVSALTCWNAVVHELLCLLKFLCNFCLFCWICDRLVFNVLNLQRLCQFVVQRFGLVCVRFQFIYYSHDI